MTALRTHRAIRPRSLRRFARDPGRAQQETLRRLVIQARETVFGTEHTFGEIASSPKPCVAYREAVPLHSYSHLLGYLERTKAGERNVLWPGVTDRFAVSSGTASSGKLIPATPTMLRHIRRCSIDALRCYFAATGRFDILAGKLMAISGMVSRDESTADVHVGEMSGLVRGAAPAWITRYWQAAPESTMAIPNWDAKLSALAQATAGIDVRAVAMVPSWSERFFEKLIEHAGLTDDGSVASVWPNLKVFFSSGVPLESYRSTLARFLDMSQVHFVELYTASEGFFAFQDAPGQDDMLLHLGSGVYYEFVPFDELGSANPRRYGIGEVETGVRYALYVSTCAGLWSYGVRDIVEFTSLHPHRIKVVGRTTEMLDNFGEAVFADEVRLALDVAATGHGASIAFCHVAPVSPSDDEPTPRHEWLFEFGHEPDSVSAFRDTLDAVLCTSNRHYQIRREARSMRRPRLVCLPIGTFSTWLGSRPRAGAQTKLPLLSNDRKIADELLDIAWQKRPGEL